MLARDEQAIQQTREALHAEIGTEALVDAAAVLANFQRMVRIADCTGIPLDEPVLMMTQNIRDELGINNYRAAAHSARLSLPQRLIGRVMGRLAPRIMRRIARSRQSA